MRPASSGRLAGRMPVSDFSGLVRIIWALAKAAARAAIDSLDRCIARLPLDHLEADRPRLGALRPHAMAERLLGILRHQPLEFRLRPFVLEEGRLGGAEQRREFPPCV